MQASWIATWMAGRLAAPRDSFRLLQLCARPVIIIMMTIIMSSSGGGGGAVRFADNYNESHLFASPHLFA